MPSAPLSMAEEVYVFQTQAASGNTWTLSALRRGRREDAPANAPSP